MLTITDSLKLTELAVASEYDLNAGTISASLTPTQWIDDGADTVISAVISILDSKGNSLVSQTIYPPMTGIVSVAIPKQDGIYKWGTYVVTVTLNDGISEYSDVVDFLLECPEKNNKNTGSIAINIKPNRNINKTGIYVSVPPPYKNTDVDSYYETTTYYYPNGSGEDNITSTFSPFEVTWYAGKSEVISEVIGTYLFDNNVSVVIKFTGSVSKNIRAANDLCLAWAAVQDLIFRLSVECDDAEKDILFEKMDAAIRLIVLVGVGQNCGYYTEDIEQELESLLGVGLTCNTIPEQEPTVLPAESIMIVGCGVERTQSGLTVRYSIPNYQYLISVTNGGSNIRETNTTNGCTKVMGLTFDWANISATVLTQFEGAYNARFLGILNTVLNTISIPSCVDTQPAWNMKTVAEKFQKAFDVQCECCGSAVDGDFTMELTCSGAVATGSYTVGIVTTAQTITIPVVVTGEGDVSANISGNGFSGVLAATAVDSETEEIVVPLTYDGSGLGGIKNATVTITTPTGTISCIVPIVIAVPANCSAPISPSASITGSTVTVAFFPASNEPPAYEVLRRLIDDPDEPGSYTTLPTPTYNVGTGKYETTEAYTDEETNILWVYKAVSLCADAEIRPYTTVIFVAQTCPELALVSDATTINYAFEDVGGDTNQYRIALYQGVTLIGSIQTKTPAFASPITGSFTGLTGGVDYTVKVFVEIIYESTTYTKECTQVKSTLPGTVTLTIGAVAGVGFETFTAVLSAAIASPIIIQNTFLDSFVACAGSVSGTMQRVSAYTIPAGSTSGGSFAYESISGTLTVHNTINPLVVNGTPVANGDSIIVGASTIVISLLQCS